MSEPYFFPIPTSPDIPISPSALPFSMPTSSGFHFFPLPSLLHRVLNAAPQDLAITAANLNLIDSSRRSNCAKHTTTKTKLAQDGVDVDLWPCGFPPTLERRINECHVFSRFFKQVEIANHSTTIGDFGTREVRRSKNKGTGLLKSVWKSIKLLNIVLDRRLKEEKRKNRLEEDGLDYKVVNDEKLSQFMPAQSYVKLVMRILRYLKLNHGKRIPIVKSLDMQLVAHVDAKLVHKNDRKSLLTAGVLNRGYKLTIHTITRWTMELSTDL
ncbi:hypothetical protein LXL04_038333 [Taraxacum kok-saghyz]